MVGLSHGEMFIWCLYVENKNKMEKEKWEFKTKAHLSARFSPKSSPTLFYLLFFSPFSFTPACML